MRDMVLLGGTRLEATPKTGCNWNDRTAGLESWSGSSRAHYREVWNLGATTMPRLFFELVNKNGSYKTTLFVLCKRQWKYVANMNAKSLIRLV